MLQIMDLGKMSLNPLPSSSAHTDDTKEFHMHLEVEGNGEPDVSQSRSSGSASASKALQLPPVMDIIAKHLPAADLFTIRETCHVWNNSFIPEIKKFHMPIEIHSDNVEKLEKVLVASESNPFVSYKITDGLVHNFGRLQSFFSRFGNSMQRLSFSVPLCQEKHGEICSTLPSIREIVFNLTPELEELSVLLHMGLDHDARYEFRQLIRRMWEERVSVQRSRLVTEPKVAKVIPKLKKLSFKSDELIHQAFVEEVLPGLRVGDLLLELLMAACALEELKMESGGNRYNHRVLTLLRDMPAPNVKRLRVLSMDEIRAEELHMLADLGRRHHVQQNALHLQKVELRGLLWSPGLTGAQIAALVTSFLQTQATYLLEFKFQIGLGNLEHGVRRPGDPREGPPILHKFNIPQMDRLQTLGISGQRFEFDYEAATFSSNFPALKKLMVGIALIEGQPNERGREFWRWTESIQHPGVKHLISTKNLPAEALSKLASTLPSLTQLEITMTEVTPYMFPAIWKSWPALQTLHIHYEEKEPRDLDQQLSGIPSWTFPTLKKELGASAPFNLDVIHWLSFPYKTKPGISDLTRLQKFVLEFQTSSYELSDIGGLFGLAMVGSGRVLKHLEINDVSRAGAQQPPQMMSPQCRELIREALGPLAYINIKL